MHRHCVCVYDSVLEPMIRFLINQIVPMGIPVSPEISTFDFCQSITLQSILRRSLGTSGGNVPCRNVFLRSCIKMRLWSAHSGEQQPYPIRPKYSAPQISQLCKTFLASLRSMLRLALIFSLFASYFAFFWRLFFLWGYIPGNSVVCRS